jgi:aromatic-amino-acid transaminase
MLNALKPSPTDSLMLAARAFVADPRAGKINLGIGMYYDETGQIPVLRSVQAASERLRIASRPWGYLQPEGLASLRSGAVRLCLQDAQGWEGRVATMQTLGGTGAVRLGAELIHSMAPDTSIAVSSPSWPNHQAIFRHVGHPVTEYAYFDDENTSLDFADMLEDIDRLERGSVVVLQGCCHNPTGEDLTGDQWSTLADVMARRELVPFLDMAYMGFGTSLADDTAVIRLLAERCCPVFIAVSFSKSFSLYGERVGALCVLTQTPLQAKLLEERARQIVRVLNSSPPSHGASLVGEVLGDDGLRCDWQAELETMRTRIVSVRAALVQRLTAGNAPRDFSSIARQRGLFSYSGLSAGQIASLREEHAIHAVEDGRLCLTALNASNIDQVADAILTVCR